MTIVPVSQINLKNLTELVLKLWPECSFEEEFNNYRKLIDAERETCFLMKIDGSYVAFIHVALRSEYVEGTNSFPVGYVEGIYVEPHFRKSGVGQQLLDAGEAWCKSKGCSEYASDVELHNEISLEFHKKSGFSEVNRIVCFVKKIE